MIQSSVAETFFLTLSSVRCFYLFVYSIIICLKSFALCDPYRGALQHSLGGCPHRVGEQWSFLSV